MNDSRLFDKLFCKMQGSGPDLVLLHGWGMNADIWDGVVPMLAKQHRVTGVDLPGHGRSGDPGSDYSLPAQAKKIAEILPAGSILVGWSLGGLLALQVALDFPRRIKALVLVASSPRFVRAGDWPDAMDGDVLRGFANELQSDFTKTIKRFLAIQVLGSEHAREELRWLRERVFAHGEPDRKALASGLDILMTADFRDRLPQLQCPTLLMSGERDTLFPVQAARRTQALLADAALHVIQGAGHAPFLSHPEEFVCVLQEFLDNDNW
ncbi:MAG: pimeloyl-ACP methyl ester esterase BioH [Gammaproteobacteria bacterium]|nr:pimeloyl-ACP methyl ester esterase BioH [Gammaproteobacteria bacterium]MCF6364562.1 pimeloyl-ACP methyl ester esterase BioH [Gammaproteobacteria bacterium]